MENTRYFPKPFQSVYVSRKSSVRPTLGSLAVFTHVYLPKHHVGQYWEDKHGWDVSTLI